MNRFIRGLLPAFIILLLAIVQLAVAGETMGIEPEAGPGAGDSLAAEAAASEPSWQDKVVIIPLKGVIIGKPFSDMPDQIMAALSRAGQEKAKLIVLEIDSPGGEVGICDTLSRKIFESKVPVVALVEHKAVSGGAMVAAAAGDLVMTRSARLGDIQPMEANIVGSSGEMGARTAEKIEVDIRTIMKVYAQGHGRPLRIFDAMVSRDMDLFQVDFSDGKTEYLDGHELKVIEENIEKGREKRTIVSTRVLKSSGKLLELTAQQAVDFGIASKVVNSVADFYADRGIRPDDMVRVDVVEGSLDLLKLLPTLDDIGLPVWVLALLGVFLIVGIAGIITEFHMPGTGVPAAIGIIGFVCFFATLLMYDRGSPVGVVVFLVGVALLVVEIMVLPGFGVPGVLGILGILSGLFMAFTPDWNSDYMRNFMWAEIGSFTLLMLVALITTILFIWLIANYGHQLPFFSSFTLKKNLGSGYNPNPEPSTNENSTVSARKHAHSLLGKTGIAESMLRPAGKVRLDSGELLDVVTDGAFVEPGTRVKVLRSVPGNTVVGIDHADEVYAEKNE